ncbi:MAG: hypothetical protein ACHP8A_14375 [Terriglobales bacterium]|jgi:hypothetical protein
MDHFEQELKKSLRRREPSSEFTARLLAALARQTRPEPPSRSPWLSLFGSRGLAAVALIVMILGSALMYRHEEQRTEGEAARQQVMVALQIASAKMRLAQSKVQNLSER